MTFITLADLAERPGTVELAQVAQQPGEPVAVPAVLAMLMRGEDMSAVPEAEADVARAAAQRISDVMEEAQALAEGYLRQQTRSLALGGRCVQAGAGAQRGDADA
ncbi:DUF1320 family protein [Salmonella enterica]|nr:DUF1320 family protein [Salmonella enterica]